MDKDKLLKIAVFTALAGLTLLFLVNIFIDVEPTPAGDIDESFIGKTVKIEGAVTKTSNIGNITLIYVDDSPIEMVVFSKIQITKGERISALGKVEEYEDRIQVVVDRISIS